MNKNQGIKNGRYKHGLRKHPLCQTWHDMKRRCYYPKHRQYKYWGGRGIVICAEWKNDFKIFYEWAIDKWKPGLQIDRIDNNGNYEPNNCQFVDNITNNANKSNTSIYGNNIRKTRYNKFQIRITNKDGKRQAYGCYDTLQEAQNIYQDKINEIRKET